MALATKSGYEQYRRYYQQLEGSIQKPKHRAYTAAIFSFLAVSLFGWYAIRPTLQTILFLRREIADKTIVSKKMEDKITSLIEAQAAYEQVIPKIPLLIQALPENTEVISLVSQLKNLTTQNGASLSAIQVGSLPLLSQEVSTTAPAEVFPAPKPAPKTLATGKLMDFPVTLVITGPYSAIRSILEGIMIMRRAVTIDSFEITPSKEDSRGTTGNSLRLIVKIHAYYFPMK